MPPPLQVDYDLLTVKVVSESRLTWATSVPSLVFLGLSVLDFGPLLIRMGTRRYTNYLSSIVCTRQTDVRQNHRFSLYAPPKGAGHNNGS